MRTYIFIRRTHLAFILCFHKKYTSKISTNLGQEYVVAEWYHSICKMVERVITKLMRIWQIDDSSYYNETLCQQNYCDQNDVKCKRLSYAKISFFPDWYFKTNNWDIFPFARYVTKWLFVCSTNLLYIYVVRGGTRNWM